jgi:protein-tyrosine phosphatase
VLFVCIGNVCRSPVAERLMDKRLQQAGTRDSFAVASAGTRALVGHQMRPESRTELEKLQGSAEGFVARRLDQGLLTSADLVLAATTEVRGTALEEAPTVLRRAFTWKELAALVAGKSAESPAELVSDASARRFEVAHLDLDTDDPINQGADVHARVVAEIDRAVTTIALALAKSATI